MGYLANCRSKISSGYQRDMRATRMEAYLAIELGNILLDTILGRHVSQVIKEDSL